MRANLSLLCLAVFACADGAVGDREASPDASRWVDEPDYYALETAVLTQLGQEPGSGDAWLGLGAPEDFSEWDVASEVVPLRLDVADPPDDSIAYYDINGVGGWFGPPNQTLQVLLAPYAVGDGSTFHIQGLLVETTTGEIIGHDSTVVYARE